MSDDLSRRMSFDFSAEEKKKRENLLFEKDKEYGRKLIDESSTRVYLDFLHYEY